MGNGRYRTVFHTALSPADAFAAARQELRSWLITKSVRQKIDIAAYDAGHAQLGDGIVLLRDSRTDGDGTQTSNWQLREHKDNGYWLSSLVVHAPGKIASQEERTWFWLDVEHVRKGDDGEIGPPSPAALPNLARKLLAMVDARDHWAELRPTPTIIRPDRVEELLEILTDERRRLPVVVASPHPRILFDTWKKTIDNVTRFLPGLASLYVMDPLAIEDFNRAVGFAFEVRSGGVRTYLPDLDLAIDEDAVRHRVLSGARIEADVRRSAQLLTAIPRQLSADGRLPEPLSRLTRGTFASRAARSTAAESPAIPSYDFSILIQENVAIRGENGELRELLELAGYEERKLRENTADLQDDMIGTAAELETANQKIAELVDWVRVLRQRLASAGRAADAYVPTDTPTLLPTQLPEVLTRLKELDRVEFTGDDDPVWRLEEKAQSSTWAQTTWLVALALQDYAEAVVGHRFNGDFRRWCTEPPSGASAISAGKVKTDESESVQNNQKMRRLRILPVPAEVEPTGRIYMGAHIRIGGGAGMSAPRLHFYDDARGTGKIYIGYLGPHLPVKTTN
ncbi:hypothetical protein Aple_071070 [Acrocarpospora pleiomorpha]|uniref:Uncharacterized protein n=1 Tax=Acrocarpospora pleiomorpha TaxID=90975 RepID=A0A5M3Y0I9_9ACTN|nr:hypothetical protein [Acrocarpospora pleiomorpha]GES24208.1 hypothetical protein Aple_071070 [Acrocarpospora pleiomorpha]